MSVLQTTAAGASRPVNARRVRGWIRGGAVGIFGLWLFNTLGGDESGPLLDLARLTGLEAGYAVLAALLLMARIPALDRRVGSDHLALLHAWVGRWIVGTAVAHTVLAILGYANVANRSIPGEIADLNTQYADVLLATVALGLFLLVGVTSARAARKRLQYETWHMVHLYTYLAIALSFAHQFSTGTDFRYTGARVIWSAMYLAVAIALLRYRVFEPLRVNWRHRLRVLDVYLESPDTVSVYLTGRALDRLDVRPGQFFRWRFAARGLWWTATPYSLSAPASADGLRITARMVGRHSNQLKTLLVGTPGVRRRPVRCAHQPASPPPQCRAHRRRRRHHTAAGAIRDPPRHRHHLGLPDQQPSRPRTVRGAQQHRPAAPRNGPLPHRASPPRRRGPALSRIAAPPAWRPARA